MALPLKSFATLVQDQAAAIQGRAAKLVDFSVGSVLRALIEGNAGIIIWLQSVALRVLAATRAATSTGADLDSFVADYGLTRLGASSAIGVVTFSRFTASVQAVIKIGATVQSADGLQTFFVTLDATNSNYNAGLGGYVMGAAISSISVPVAAVAPGVAGNVLAGAVTVVTSSIPYVDTVINDGPFSLGGEAESDAALRARFRDYIASLSRGTVNAIRFAINSLKVGVQSTVIENVYPDGTTGLGYLTITVDDGTGAPPQTLLNDALAAANLYRAGGIMVGVFPPTVVPVRVAMGLTIADGYNNNQIIGDVGLTVTGYVNSLELGEMLSITRIAQIAHGVSSGIVSINSLEVDGLFVDTIVTPRQVIKPLSVTVV